MHVLQFTERDLEAATAKLVKKKALIEKSEHLKKEVIEKKKNNSNVYNGNNDVIFLDPVAASLLENISNVNNTPKTKMICVMFRTYTQRKSILQLW
nr:10055_t:CDS:2 [Entrophospora candida]